MSDDDRWGSFTILVATHKTSLFRYSLRRLNDFSSCQEVVDETFLIAWRRWDERPAKESELPWLYGIAYRVLSNSRRSRDRRDRLYARLSLERPNGDTVIEESGVDTYMLSRAMQRLKASERELLRLVYWEELTYREISEVLAISENAVGIRINRAKKNLRHLLFFTDITSLDHHNIGEGLEQ